MTRRADDTCRLTRQEVADRQHAHRESAQRPAPEPMTIAELRTLEVRCGAQPPSSPYRRLVATALGALLRLAELEGTPR